MSTSRDAKRDRGRHRRLRSALLLRAWEVTDNRPDERGALPTKARRRRPNQNRPFVVGVSGDLCRTRGIVLT